MFRCVQIKTIVASTTVAEALVHRDSAYMKSQLGDGTCNTILFIYNQLQGLHQSLNKSRDELVYVCAYESQILYKLFIDVSEDIVKHAKQCMNTRIGPGISYVYTERLTVPSEVDLRDAPVWNSYW